MTIGAIFSGLISLAKAVPIIDKRLSQLVEMYIDSKIQQVESVLIDKQTKRTLLLRDITKAKTNAERKAYSEILHTIDNPGGM
jgi:hypothetical protein